MQGETPFKTSAPGWLQAASAWLFIVVLTALLGCATQWLIFADAHITGQAYLLRWPILWLLYLFIAMAVTEQFTRLLVRRRGRCGA